MSVLRIASGLCVVALVVSSARAQLGSPITETRSIAPDSEIESNSDSPPLLVTDGQGTWVASWKSTEPSPCANLDTARYVVSTSVDDGLSWGPAVRLEPMATGTASTLDDPASVATDGDGTWLAVWGSRNPLGDSIDPDRDILFARSTDGGITWTAPAPVNTNAASDGVRQDRKPRVATDGMGRWAVVWFAAPVPSSPGQFLEHDIYVARSDDAGSTWSDPEFVNHDATTDDRNDWNPLVATDGDTWLAVWTSFDDGVSDLHHARSVDGGVTWSPVDTLISPGYSPSVATDGDGNWMIGWSTNSTILGLGSDWDVLMSSSEDDGLTWSSPRAINTTAFTDGSAYDARPAIAADGRGNWAAVWESDNDMGGTLGSDWDILVARSSDLGLSWTDPDVFNSDAATDTGDASDLSPSLATDRRATWVATWTKQSLDARAATFRLPFLLTCGADGDGDGYGAPGDASCPLGAATDCDDSELWVAPGVAQACDGLNNDCNDSSWPLLVGVPEDDADGDGVSGCAGDCDDQNGNVWSRPGEVELLLVGKGGGAALSWSAPREPGATPAALVYDVIRSSFAKTLFCPSVGDPAVCVESDDGPNTTAVDAQSPHAGQVFFYLVRADHACEGNAGSFGRTSSQAFRPGVECP